uniref:NBS-LRR disease resistance protein NBS48 n=1 Tax=Dimocarpus longan TaxID=128017 RepID=A0A0F6TN75_9ROSI|nr:NBS-LRR disease resistance protein NBS48 [Dimocarpus longan]
MAEHVLSAVLSVLLKKLTPGELLEFATQGCVRSKLKKWEKTLKMINALLIDAEEKQLTNGAVKMWLEELQDLAYDAEDILDEYATEALRRKLKIEEHQASTSTVRKLIPTCCVGFSPSALRSNFSMRSEIDEVTTRLEDLCKRRSELGLENIAGGRSVVSWQRPTTTCFPTESVVHGRDEDKAKVLELLRSETGDAPFGVVPIVGMGGIGKTTLARQVYNDKAAEDFNLKAWVCVSDDFDVVRISKAILESVTGCSCDLKELNAVQSQLTKEIAGKQFLLVLDDVWSEDDSLWETLRSPFLYGAQGSKIIVTTRLQDVAKTVKPKGFYKLDPLSDDKCWSLFMQFASEGRDDVVEWNVEDIRQKVVQKCDGLPLAAKTLGGLLRRKKSKDEWMEILDNKIWDLRTGDNILPVLRLSYYHLPSDLKRCFAYSAIFPKDYEFEEKELVFLWMAEGLIQQSGDDKHLEKLGGECFHDLVSRSIFQVSASNNNKFIMHDLINDLAQSVSGCMSFRLESEHESHNQSKIFVKARYSSNVCRRVLHSYVRRRVYSKGNFKVFESAKHLRTHLSVKLEDYNFRCCYISNSVVHNLLLKFKKLRVLSLQGYGSIELSNSIGDLRLLRYLNLSYSGIRSLPESINSMCNLQTLLLRGCKYLLELPCNMRNLIKLRHIDISGASLIKKMPFGIGNWKFLTTLSNFIVAKSGGSRLKDLRCLEFLYGQLHISSLENVIEDEDTREIILSDKKDLKVLLLEWGVEVDDSRNEEVDKNVLDMLRPHQNLEELTIRCYGGTKFPSWVGDSSFSKMTGLTLEGCKKCTCLPSLGLLGSLKHLTIRKMRGVKDIGSEFYGEVCLKPFPSLETILFEDLEEWERWDTVQENDSVEIFLKLRQLSIVQCPKLSAMLPHNLYLLEKLVVRDCAKLVVSVATSLVLRELEIDECKDIICSGSPTSSNSLKRVILSNITDFGSWLKQDFRRVEVLEVNGCDELINLWQNEIFLEKPPQGLHSLISMRTLDITNCKTLTTLLEGVKQRNAHLENVEIKDCDSLTNIFREQLPPSLKILSVKGCEKLQCLLEDDDESNDSSSSMTFKEKVNSHSSHLDKLEIGNCPSLMCLPLTDQFSATLTNLVINGCLKLTTVSLPIALKHLRIYNCPKLTVILPRGQLPKTIEVLDMYKCESLESIVEGFHNNPALHTIEIFDCDNLKSIPNGLHTLSSLHSFEIKHCRDLVSFPTGGFPNCISSVSIHSCEKLKDLPSGLHTLTSLQDLDLFNCPSLSYPEEGFPSNLSSLGISNPNLCKTLNNWGLHNLTSLKDLYIHELSDADSFHEEIEMTLPPTVTFLWIQNFPKLKFLSSKSLENLNSLECLGLQNCPALTSFPSLPSSLLELCMYHCPLLKEACKKDKGKEWYKIADIPCVKIDGKSIHDP